MSAFGGSAQDIVRELRTLTDEIRNFGGGLREAANALPGVGFAANTAAKSLQTFARDVGFGFAEDTFRFGTSYAGTAFDSNLLRAAAAIPTDPLDAARTQNPIENAFNRLGGITGPIARAGGHVDMDVKKQLANLLHRQEYDAGLDALENQWLQGKFAQSKLAGRGGLSGMWGVSAEDFGAALKSEAGDVLRRWFGVNVR